MVATSGDRLLAPDAVDALARLNSSRARWWSRRICRRRPRCSTRRVARNEAEMEAQAQRAAGARRARVLIKGGHGEGAESVDLLVGRGRRRRGSPRQAHRDPKHPRHRLHAVVGDRRGARQGRRSRDAARDAKAYVTAAIAAADSSRSATATGRCIIFTPMAGCEHVMQHRDTTNIHVARRCSLAPAPSPRRRSRARRPRSGAW